MLSRIKSNHCHYQLTTLFLKRLTIWSVSSSSPLQRNPSTIKGSVIGFPPDGPKGPITKGADIVIGKGKTLKLHFLTKILSTDISLSNHVCLKKIRLLICFAYYYKYWGQERIPCKAKFTSFQIIHVPSCIFCCKSRGRERKV